MNIDRSNYEIWIIDWLDGNLSGLRAEELKLFLEKNPDIREEFEELSSFSLKPSQEHFPNKDLLKKGTSDLSSSQFEYLCVAYLENDLSDIQKTELDQIIDNDPEKKRIFDLIQKVRLTPQKISYSYKNHLLKKSPVQRVIRMTVAISGAAAAVALIIAIWLLAPRSIPEKINGISEKTIPDTTQARPHQVIPEKQPAKQIAAITTRKGEDHYNRAGKNIPDNIHPDSLTKAESDLLLTNIRIDEMPFEKVPVHIEINLPPIPAENRLVASAPIPVFIDYDDGRSNIGKFIAKTIREKILKDKTVKNTPLKPYEIAEAGITGLNKLLGWEMALNEKTDVNGNIKSVYFSSRILKFNAPVKNSEPLQ